MSKLVSNYTANGSSTTDEYGTFVGLNRFLQGDVIEGFAVVANSSPNMTVYVQPGSGRITTGTYPSSYGYLISHDTGGQGEAVTIATANASARIDYVVAYIDKSVAGSTSGANVNNTNNVLKFASVAGTPSGSPVVPTVSQIQTAIGAANPYIILAQIAVGISVSTITNPNITDLRTFATSRSALALGATSYVDNGCLWTISGGLAGTMTKGLAYINVNGVMVPVTLAAIASNTFTANQDTYVYVNVLGTVGYLPVANGAASPSLPANSIWLAKVISGASAITSIQMSNRTSLGNQIRPQSASTQSGFASDAVQHNYTTATTLLTVSLANAPAGDYIVMGKVAIEPNGGGNCSVNVTTTSTTAILPAGANNGAGVHGSDADWNTGKYAHRTFVNSLQGHQGGSFTVSLVFSPEAAVAFQVGYSGDPRWASTLSVIRA